VHCFTNGLDGELPSNITVTHLADTPLVKTRFVDRDNGYRLFESKSSDLDEVRRDPLPDFDDYDVVLIADFGHGLLDKRAINARIAQRRRAHVAVMAQVNSSNYGYNLPTKYAGADYYSANRTEAELCLHERGLPLDELIERMAGLLDARALSVTDGENGAIVMSAGRVVSLPTLSTSVVDTIGCGDAYFTFSSLAAAMRCPTAVVGLAGSIGAAAVAQRRGNESPTSEQEFLTIGKIVI
jgi:sugar/nucleoside kinase (ribokinase family)